MVFFLKQRTQIFVVSISKQLLIAVLRFNSGNFSCVMIRPDKRERAREREREIREIDLRRKNEFPIMSLNFVYRSWSPEAFGGLPKRREVRLTKKLGPRYHISPLRRGEVASHLEQFSGLGLSQPCGVPRWPPAVSFYYSC